MSLGYAEKLSFRADVGTVGMPELFDSPSVLETKVTELANLIKESRHLVVFTGAGISTSCGIPDFRGPKGIWTLQRDGKPMPKTDMPFHQARPGLTHMALVELHQAGILKFIVSQNIDGLHLRSGIPREMLAELHGNSFRESCPSCGKEYIRDFEVETIGLKPTGRRCMVSSCKAKLVDTIVDWEDALPSKDLRLAEKNCKKADVVLCLGTSLQITPACNLPLKAVRAGGKLVIVNLQATPKDKNASLLIRGLVDMVVAGVMKNLHLSVPPYVRIDKISVGCAFAWTRKESVVWKLRVTSTHGQRAPLPFVRSVEVSFPDRPEMKCMMLTEQPFIIRRETMRLKSVNALIKLHFAEGSMCKSADVLHCLQFEEPEEEEETQNTDKAVEMLRLQATKDSSCGQVARMDAIDLPRGNGLAVQYAVVTGILRHSLDEVKQAADLQAAAETQKATAESPVTERKRFAEDSEEKNSAENKRTRTSQRRVSGRKRKSTS